MGANISALIPELQPYARDLLDVCGAAGLQPRITSTLRSSAEQARLYRRYQQGLQQYPVAPPGTSAHEFGFAFDMVIADLDSLPDVGAYWKDQGGVWGGEFNDPIHFEFPGFKATPQHSLAYTVGTTALGLVTPAVGEGITLSVWLRKHGWTRYALQASGGFELLAPFLDWEIDNLPQWVKDTFDFFSS